MLAAGIFFPSRKHRIPPSDGHTRERSIDELPKFYVQQHAGAQQKHKTEGTTNHGRRKILHAVTTRQRLQ